MEFRGNRRVARAAPTPGEAAESSSYSTRARHGQPIKRDRDSWHLFSLVLTCLTRRGVAARAIYNQYKAQIA